jgi:hypothetical protein
MTRRAWTREELIVAFNLYCKLPYGRMHQRNPLVIDVAAALGRTPGAVAMKLVNFAAFDPAHQKRGVSGLKNASQADRTIWDEFNGNWEDLAAESERIFRDQLRSANRTAPDDQVSDDVPAEQPEETERFRTQKERLGQAFFREVVLGCYGSRCCICDLPDRRLLVASHIVPWSQRKDSRVNPQNGLCLCALHDRAFDRGLLSIDAGLRVLVSDQLAPYLPQPIVEGMFLAFRGRPVRPPDKFGPASEFLEYHREHIFKPV